jgi:hypothetical protein
VPRIGASVAGERFTAEAMTTFGLVMEAYDLKGYLIALGTPNLPVTDTQYDIAAKTGGGTVPSRAEFRQMLQALFIDRPVVNRTGLDGIYDLRLTYTPDIRSNRHTDSSPADVSIFTAVQEQPGLRLEPMQAPIEALVIDKAEKPDAN